MKFQLDLPISELPFRITHHDKIMLIGSCFTEHIGNFLTEGGFRVCSNPHGILFNPLSVAQSVQTYTEAKMYTEQDLFFMNELWNSWAHHTRFSHPDKALALEGINRAQAEAANFVREASLMIVTLGSAFQYFHVEEGIAVANNHRAPAACFEKRLLSVAEIEQALQQMTEALRAQNPSIKLLYTVSPVRHIREGVVNNNRSKARLLEAVHTVCESDPTASFYFPAYELVLDVLRDYRFFDVDMVHPNYAATQFVWEQFSRVAFDEETKRLIATINELNVAVRHKTRFPETQAHKDFCKKYAGKANELQALYPHLQLAALAHFKDALL